ncbi:MAG: antibiotic biosynthesis monooxygenase [Ktedonobacterales bacterium]
MANKVMTVLEAHVAEERWEELEQVIASRAGQRPAPLETTYLVQSADDPTIWRLVGIWRSREELEQYRQSVEVIGGVQMLRSVGAEPTMNMYEIKGS